MAGVVKCCFKFADIKTTDEQMDSRYCAMQIGRRVLFVINLNSN